MVEFPRLNRSTDIAIFEFQNQENDAEKSPMKKSKTFIYKHNDL